jgi:translation initiation factor IF-3
MKKKVEELAKKGDYEIVEFSPEKRLYVIKVKHFTKYNFGDSDDDKKEKEEEKH